MDPPNVEAKPQLHAHLKSDPGSKLKRGADKLIATILNRLDSSDSGGEKKCGTKLQGAMMYLNRSAVLTYGLQPQR
jgi:hypothetical protein